MMPGAAAPVIANPPPAVFPSVLDVICAITSPPPPVTGPPPTHPSLKYAALKDLQMDRLRPTGIAVYTRPQK